MFTLVQTKDFYRVKKAIFQGGSFKKRNEAEKSLFSAK